MKEFLQLFGTKSIGWLVAVICAAIFLYACYKKIESYFSEKAIREKEKDEKIKRAMDQVEKYPTWHQQSIDIRDKMDRKICGVADKLDYISQAIAALRKEVKETRIISCRYRILRFDDEIRHDEKHSKEHFDQILDDITEYEKYCEKNPDFKNNKAVLAIKNIKRIYQNCVNEGTFL